MQTISANEIKVKGVAAIELALRQEQEVAVAVRGEKRFVVMALDQYEHLRECELEAAWYATRSDIASGKARTMTAAAHRLDMEKRLANTPASRRSYVVQQERAPYSVAKPAMKSTTQTAAQKSKTSTRAATKKSK